MDVEREYRRFQDFGLVLGFSFVVFLIAAAIKIVVEHNFAALLILRTTFYAVLLWNLWALRHCVRSDSPVAGLAGRNRKEIGIAVVIVLMGNIAEGVCFELI